MAMNRALGWIQRIRADDSGATALEFAIVASAFIVVSMGIVEFGRSLQVRNQMAYAMDNGARALMMDRDATENDIREAVKARFNSYDKEKLTVNAPSQTIACKSDGEDGTMAIRAVSVSYPLDIFIPGFTGALDIKLERTVPEGECVV